MKPVWLLALVLAACADDSRTSTPAKIDVTQTRRSVDPKTSGSDIRIRGLDAVRGPREGEVTFSYRIQQPSDGRVTIPVLIVCRVGDRNLAYPASSTATPSAPRQTSVFRPEPLVAVPSTCQISFHLVDVEHPIAHACFEREVLRDGPCGTESFASPVLTDANDVAIERLSLELNDSTALVSGIFTPRTRLPSDRRFVGVIACRDDRGRVTGEGAFSFVDLQALAPGTSMFGPLAMLLDRTPGNDAHCELRVVSRPATTTGASQIVHARYCLTTSQVEPCK